MTLKEVTTFLAGLSLGPFLIAIVNHFLGTRRDKQQREREHYERYLAEAKAALESYVGFVDDWERGDPVPEEFEQMEAVLQAAFSKDIAKAALAPSRDGGETYQVTVARMRDYIAKLERKAGHPARPSL